MIGFRDYSGGTSNKASKILFLLISLEVFLMGSGRILEIGPVTIRMILFSVAIIFSFFLISLNKPVSAIIYFLLFYFCLATGISVFIGISNGALLDHVFLDVKPLLFFLMILFIFFSIDGDSISKVYRVVILSASLLSVFYFCFLFLVYFDFVGYDLVYVFLSALSDDFMFRGSGSESPFLFYKGFIFLCVGLVFAVFHARWLLSLIFFAAILLTFTRGFVVALFLSFFIYWALSLRRVGSVVLFCFCALTFSIVIYSAIGYMIKPESDSIRLVQIDQVFDMTSWISLLFGHGFGIGVDVRPIHMEIAWLEVFHKQGLVGLLFWFFCFFVLLASYINLRHKNELDKSFFVGSLVIFTQSLTNPYMNNPMGLFFLMVSMVYLVKRRHGHLENLTMGSAR